MFVGYNVSVRLHSWVTVFVLAALALLMLWLLRNSFRFRLYNTSWRGTRFHFRGTVGRAYRVFLLNGFLTLITLYILLPFAHQRLKAYQHDNTRFGRTQCSFHARAGHQMSPALLADALETIAKSRSDSSSPGGYLSSHPSTTQRLRRLRELAASFEAK